MRQESTHPRPLKTGKIASLADLVTFLKEFHAGWNYQAVDAAVIPRDLPQPLFTIHKEFGSLIEMGDKGPFSGHYTLLPIASLRRVENQLEFGGDYVAGFSFRCDLAVSDCPVYSDADQEGFEEVCDSLCHFLTTFCLLQAVGACRHSIAFHPSADPKRLIRNLTPIWEHGSFAWRNKDVFDFFAVPGRKVLVMTCGFGWPTIVGSPEGPVDELLLPEAARFLEN